MKTSVLFSGTKFVSKLNMSADLHVHLKWNGGEVEPEEFFRKAFEKKLEGIALLNVNFLGFPDDMFMASRRYGLFVLPGVQVDLKYKGINMEFSILFDSLNLPERVVEYFEHVKSLHSRRMGLLLEHFNVVPDVDFVTVEYLYRVVREIGLFEGDTIQQFHEYISRFHSSKDWVVPDIFELLEVLKDTSHILVINAPGRIAVNIGLKETLYLVSDLFDFGVHGIEVWYPENDQSISSIIEEIAINHNKLLLGGSNISLKEDMGRLGYYTCPRNYYMEVVNTLKKA